MYPSGQVSVKDSKVLVLTLYFVVNIDRCSIYRENVKSLLELLRTVTGRSRREVDLL